MFIRFRSDGARHYVSLVRTRRVEGKVRQEHVASLGSIILSPSVADRVAFWARLHERLSKLANRIDPAAQGKIMGDIHARVPMPTPDEQRALQLENAKVDADQWSAIRDMTASTIADRQKLTARVETQIVADKAAVIEADNAAKQAQGRLDAIQRGEPVEGGLGKPVDLAALLKLDGWTEADLRHARLLGSMPEERFEAFIEILIGLQIKTDRRLSTRAVLAILRKYGERDDEAKGGKTG